MLLVLLGGQYSGAYAKVIRMKNAGTLMVNISIQQEIRRSTKRQRYLLQGGLRCCH